MAAAVENQEEHMVPLNDAVRDPSDSSVCNSIRADAVKELSMIFLKDDEDLLRDEENRVETDNDETKNTIENLKKSKHITFSGDIDIAEYETVIADNPGGNLSGAPIGLGGKVAEHRESFEEFTNHDKKTHMQMILSDKERRNILVNQGYTPDEIVAAAAVVADIRKKREQSKHDKSMKERLAKHKGTMLSSLAGFSYAQGAGLRHAAKPTNKQQPPNAEQKKKNIKSSKTTPSSTSSAAATKQRPTNSMAAMAYGYGMFRTQKKK